MSVRVRIMSVADRDPSRYFCDDCWATGETDKAGI